MGTEGSPSARKFGTFTGVFTPTLLTILGVILYVRLPWVVGNGGLLGALGVMGLALVITVCTGLSLSSIATNTRLGAGGPYAMITRSLGLEVGGSIGVPLFLSRPLGIAMYIFGFREGWQWMFPSHHALIVDLAVFALLFGLAYLSADIAFRVQFAIMAVILVSLVSIIASPRLFEPQGTLELWGHWEGFPEDGFEGVDFWVVFAVFFPATTGILAGANMSGDLEDPRRSISRGTLWAIVLSAVIYFGLAVWASYIGSMEELRGSLGEDGIADYNFFIDASYFPAGVIAGLLGATFSSALASAVGGPRILMAMGENKIMPRSAWWAKTSKRGEPRNAVALTAVLTFGCLMMRDLNAIAPLVTMFFLITYLMINVVYLIETSLGLVSFRPSLRVHPVVPLVGAIGCVFTMFIVNPTFGLIAVGTSVAIFIGISRLGIGGGEEDVRSSIFESVAEWAAAKVVQLGGQNVRSWKPDVLFPLADTGVARGAFRFLVETCRPEGSLNLLTLETDDSPESLEADIEELGHDFRKEHVFTRWSTVTSASFAAGVLHGLQALQSAFFRPNILFLVMPRDPEHDAENEQLIKQAREVGVGVIMLGRHPDAGLGKKTSIKLWLQRDRSGWDVVPAFENNNLDLTLLMGFRFMRAWNAELTVATAVQDESQVEQASAFLTEVCDLARLPKETKHAVEVGPFLEAVTEAPQADLHILGFGANPECGRLRGVIERTGASCLFVADSGRESARA